MNNIEIDNYSGKNHGGAHPNLPVKFLTATSMIGDKVFNLAGEAMGDIKDIMIDLDGGRIEYIVIELGGFLGIGEKYFALPYSVFRVDAKRQAFILNQSREILENTPGFDKDHWPQTNSHQFGGSSIRGGFMGPNTGGAH